MKCCGIRVSSTNHSNRMMMRCHEVKNMIKKLKKKKREILHEATVETNVFMCYYVSKKQRRKFCLKGLQVQIRAMLE